MPLVVARAHLRIDVFLGELIGFLETLTPTDALAESPLSGVSFLTLWHRTRTMTFSGARGTGEKLPQQGHYKRHCKEI
ncbi:hypothetical protein [Nocardia abscessus]|uniref:hypothetical protein n=1 Tax=Nocardia abscessus TaxID=120957 RepID=UPI00245891A1|nr:hypothetical protein [Nocardia abscessus]